MCAKPPMCTTAWSGDAETQAERMNLLPCSQEGMIDVKSRRCAAEGCNKYPAFNLPGENTARFCGDHRQPGMIDVHNKRCAFEGCQKRPTFNYVGKAPPLITVYCLCLRGSSGSLSCHNLCSPCLQGNRCDLVSAYQLCA